MGGEDRIALVQSIYERFNERDIEGVLAGMANDVEWPDIVDDSVVVGKDAYRDYLVKVMETTNPRIIVGEVVEVGDVVFAMAYHQAFDVDGKLLGRPRVVTSRFSFNGDLVSRFELSSPDELSDEVRQRLPAP